MVKVKHTHEDGSVCLTADRNYSQVGLYRFNGQDVYAAYYPYTGHWYLFEAITGNELATVDRKFFESCFSSLKIADAKHTTDC